MLMTAQEMIEKQRASYSSQATQILMKMFNPELAKAAKMPSCRRINVYIEQNDQMVIGVIVRSLRDVGYRVEVKKAPDSNELCFTLGW